MSKQAGLHPGFTRFGVGSEYDLYAPDCDQSEAVLIVGSEYAPTGYAWVFPWGNQRVRAGVGVLHPDRTNHPDKYLEKLLKEAGKSDINLHRAQPLEYHSGLIPFSGVSRRLAGNGIVAVGDAGGQPSAVAGEGIRWAIKAGKMAGSVIGEAVRKGDCSAVTLSRYERRWNAAYGKSLHLAYEMSLERVTWTDQEMDAGVDLLKLLTPGQFALALQTDFSATCILRMVSGYSRLVKNNLRERIETALTPLLSPDR